MNVESINISQKSLHSGARKTLPTGKVINLKDENIDDPVEARDLT